MAISDRTRKILWGRSGNRCALCSHELVVDATPSDDESVVGEECHIISGRIKGPRHDPAFPIGRIDEIENLILLCRIHHKMVDDQFETYSVDMLRTMKSNHELWVSEQLTGRRKRNPKPIRRIRIEENIPTSLPRLTSGHDIMNIVKDAMWYEFGYDDPQSEAELDLVSGFLQRVQDWGGLPIDLDLGRRIRVISSLNDSLAEVEQAGFWVFGAQEIQQLEGEDFPTTPCPAAIIRVLRASSPEIIKSAKQ